MNIPNPITLVLGAFHDLKELEGSTLNKIMKYINSNYPQLDRKSKKHVPLALWRLVSYSIVKKDKQSHQVKRLGDGSQHKTLDNKSTQLQCPT
jgi:hypothetical protein